MIASIITRSRQGTSVNARDKIFCARGNGVSIANLDELDLVELPRVAAWETYSSGPTSMRRQFDLRVFGDGAERQSEGRKSHKLLPNAA